MGTPLEVKVKYCTGVSKLGVEREAQVAAVAF